MNENSDATRGLIRRVDPAAALAPVSADRLTRLTEDAMTTEPTTRPAVDPAPRSRPGLRTWLIAGAGTLAAGAAAALVLPTLLAPPTVTTLQLSNTDPLTTMCLEITPDVVAASDIAFRAEVTGIEGGVVSLRVTERFAGEVGDIVQVDQGDDEPIDGAPLVFVDGATYLVSTEGTTIGSCGESGIVSPELEAIYDAAFPG
jgi:hypothetical protein